MYFFSPVGKEYNFFGIVFERRNGFAEKVELETTTWVLHIPALPFLPQAKGGHLFEKSWNKSY